MNDEAGTSIDDISTPLLDAVLVARMAAAKDEHGIVHDKELAAEYLVAMQAHQEELARHRGEEPAAPVPEGERIFPDAG
ncbi:MAG: hypothetical protein JWN72_1498 [Thermoleophilia bacterium]|nr:hypothetical protein [Thermoleophilia bacterium]